MFQMNYFIHPNDKGQLSSATTRSIGLLTLLKDKMSFVPSQNVLS